MPPPRARCPAVPGSQSEWAFPRAPPIATRDRGRRASGRGRGEEPGCRAFQSSRNWLSSLSELYLPIDSESHWRCHLNFLVLIRLCFYERFCLPSRWTHESKKQPFLLVHYQRNGARRTAPPMPPNPTYLSPNHPKLRPSKKYHPYILNLLQLINQFTILRVGLAPRGEKDGFPKRFGEAKRNWFAVKLFSEYFHKVV